MPPAVRQTGMVPLVLWPGCRIILEAIDPSTDNAVAGVGVADAVVTYADAAGRGADDSPPLPVWLQPLTEG